MCVVGHSTNCITDEYFGTRAGGSKGGGVLKEGRIAETSNIKSQCDKNNLEASFQSKVLGRKKGGGGKLWRARRKSDRKALRRLAITGAVREKIYA